MDFSRVALERARRRAEKRSFEMEYVVATERRFTRNRLAGAFPGIDLMRLERVTRDIEPGQGEGRSIDTLAWGRRAVS